MSGFDITGRVAIVTGGSKGIGFGMALDLAEAGADVAIVSRHLDEGEAAAEEIRKRGKRDWPYLLMFVNPQIVRCW